MKEIKKNLKEILGWITIIILITLITVGAPHTIDYFFPEIKEKQQEETDSKTAFESQFTTHKLDNYYAILVDNDNSVCYLKYEASGGYYAIVNMTNPDGTPKIWRK